MAAIDLTGKPICITGASSGIGRATAIACAKAGMPVVCNARREDRLEELVKEIERFGGRAAALPGDIAHPSVGRALIECGLERFGSVYGVFANAGYGVEAAIHEMIDEDLRDIFETNFFGTMHTIGPAVDHMLERGSGHILICSSCLARLPMARYGAYSATKAAQHHIARAMNVELAERGVHVSSVMPVGTKTEFFDETRRRSSETTLLDRTGERFMQKPEKVARAIVKCLRRPKPEVWTSRTTLWSFALLAATPRMTDWIVRSAVRKRKGRAGKA